MPSGDLLREWMAVDDWAASSVDAPILNEEAKPPKQVGFIQCSFALKKTGSSRFGTTWGGVGTLSAEYEDETAEETWSDPKEQPLLFGIDGAGLWSLSFPQFFLDGGRDYVEFLEEAH